MASACWHDGTSLQKGVPSFHNPEFHNSSFHNSWHISQSSSVLNAASPLWHVVHVAVG